MRQELKKTSRHKKKWPDTKRRKVGGGGEIVTKEKARKGSGPDAHRELKSCMGRSLGTQRDWDGRGNCKYSKKNAKKHSRCAGVWKLTISRRIKYLHHRQGFSR